MAHIPVESPALTTIIKRIWFITMMIPTFAMIFTAILIRYTYQIFVGEYDEYDWVWWAEIDWEDFR